MARINTEINLFHSVKSVRFGVFLVRFFPLSDQNNSEYGHFSRSVSEETVLPKSQNSLTMYFVEQCT